MRAHDRSHGFGPPREPFWFDADGVLTERVTMQGREVIIHYDDVPDSHITEVAGFPCTTALRTLIDLATELERAELVAMVRDCLARSLFTEAEARQRLAMPDMANRVGAERLRDVLGI